MDLNAKASQLGIQTEYVDAHGRQRTIDPAALRSVLDAMPQTPDRILPGVVIARDGQPGRSELPASSALPIRWAISRGNERLAEGVAQGREIEWPSALPHGIHRVDLSDAQGGRDSGPFIAAPASAFQGDFDRSWLLAVQLYSVRSQRNWGIGDFTDLARLIELAAALGADGVGLNPLHALFDERPNHCSPYSPNSRLFLNPLYIDVEALPEFDGERPATASGAADVIDYEAIGAAKYAALRRAFTRFRADGDGRRRAAFEDYCGKRGALLRHFASFEVLRHRFKRPWWEWPAEWRKPDEAACSALAEGEKADEIAFVCFMQWCAEEQLGACRDRAKELGLRIGLYLDVAVGVQSDGFDAWNEQLAISRALGVGAPPDTLNTAGQSWGLAGFNAAGLQARGFAPFRDMLEASMRYAGAIRLDHVLGLKRLYLIPEGFGPENGVYVQMPFEALLAVTALESQAHRCVVIGEDLGTVPEGFRERLNDWGIWSYRLMMFERAADGGFVAPDHYLSKALVTFSTHDLATYSGWRASTDLATKRDLDIDPGESDDDRSQALAKLGGALRGQGIARDDFFGVAEFLSRTQARILAVALEDLLGVLEQPNIPGTVDEHPNWRRRLPVSLEDIGAAIDRSALKEATAERRRTTQG